MRSVNLVVIIGNITRDPELRTTSSGEKVITFGVATNREWMSNGSQQKSTEFHEVVAWAKLAEVCSQFLKKGSLVYIEGYLKTRSWESKEDNGKRFKTEIIAQNVISLDKKRATILAEGPLDNHEDYSDNNYTEEETKDIPPHTDEEAPSENTSSGLTIDSELGL